MKVLVLLSCVGTYGGIEAFALALAEYLATVDGIDVRLCLKKTKTHAMTADFERVLKASGIQYRLVSRLSPALALEIRQADIVHAQNAPPDVALLCRVLGKPLVLTIHNWHRRQPRLRASIGRRVAQSAQARLYNSKFVQETWEPQPLPGSQCVPTVSRLPQGSLPPEARHGFVFISRWVPNKGLEVLVEAYLRAKIDHRQWPLTLVGDGPLRARVEALLADAGALAAHVRMTGFIADDEKHQLLRQSRWLVAPAHTREDLGLTPIEARSVGVPSIVTRDGGLPEAGGPAAILVEPASVAELQAALEHAAAMSEADYAARARQAQASLETFLRPMRFYPDLYATLVAKTSD